MADIVWADVEAIAPELSAVPVAAQVMYLGLANDRVSVGYFGGEDANMTKLARVYLAAHFGALDPTITGNGSNGARGPVTQEKLGAMSRSYADPNESGTTSSSMYGSTVYGRQFAALARMTTARLGLTT